jgi:hypothetical protein
VGELRRRRAWQSLKRNLPPVPVHDLVVKEGDLVVATHGRSFYIMDDVSALRQLSAQTAAAPAHLYRPRDAYRITWGGGGGGEGGRAGRTRRAARWCTTRSRRPTRT